MIMERIHGKICAVGCSNILNDERKRYEMDRALFCISHPESCEIVYANETFCTLFGECIGKNTYAVLSAEKDFQDVYRGCAPLENESTRTDITRYLRVNAANCMISMLVPWRKGMARMDLLVSRGWDAVTTIERIGAAGCEMGDIVVKCFGAFEIMTEKGRLTATDFASPQCCMMLVYLLCNRHRDVSIQELGDVLWPDQSVASPYNMIKNIVLRTRRVLERVTDEQFIVINNGIYGINPELTITMESEAFESVYMMAKAKKLDAQQHETLCERAMSLYGGTLFPTMANESWLSARSAYYQLLYIDCVLTCMKIQESRGDRLAMYRTATASVKNVFHDASIQFALVMSELRIGNITQARALYVNNEPLFSEEQRKQYNAALEKLAAKA